MERAGFMTYTVTRHQMAIFSGHMWHTFFGINIEKKNKNKKKQQTRLLNTAKSKT